MSHLSFTLFTLHLQGALLFPNHLQGLFQCPSSQKVSIPWKSSGFRFKIFNLGLLLMIRLRRYITNIASLDRMVGDHRPRLLITYYIFLSLDLTTFSPTPLPSLLSVRWFNVELRWDAAESGGGGGYFSPSSCTQRITFYHYRLYFLKGLLASYLDNNDIIINTDFNWNIMAIKGTLFLHMRKSLLSREWCVKEPFAHLEGNDVWRSSLHIWPICSHFFFMGGNP